MPGTTHPGSFITRWSTSLTGTWVAQTYDKNAGYWVVHTLYIDRGPGENELIGKAGAARTGICTATASVRC